nr:hypothetical protein GCM10020093_040320 [Planobispora longispora]
MEGPVPDVAEAPEEDVTFLLGVLNSVLGTAVRREEVAGTFAGLRPLLAAEERAGDAWRAPPTCPGSTRCSPPRTGWSPSWAAS